MATEKTSLMCPQCEHPVAAHEPVESAAGHDYKTFDVFLAVGGVRSKGKRRTA